MVKKRLALVCAALLASSLLAGCGSGAGSQDVDTGNAQTQDGGAADGSEQQNDGAADGSEQQNDGATDGSEQQNDGSTDGSEQQNDGATDGSGQQNAGGTDGSSETTDDDAQEEEKVLRDAIEETFGCRMGAAVTQGEIQDEKVWEIITTYFSAITIGNELKPDAMFGYSVTDCPGTEEAELNGETIVVPKMDYSRAEFILDKVLEWNNANPDRQIKVRGHVLVWHAQTPEWFFHVDYDKNKDYVDKETMDKRLEWYIRTMLTHFTGEDSKYKGMFYGWDVVNEAISDATGTYRSDKENPDEPLSQDRHNNNSSWWHVYQSNEDIINAFRYANKYAPADLELYYNDYNECSSTKQIGIVSLLKAVKEQAGAPGEGTRIDAMGMQGHYGMTSPSTTEFDLALEVYGRVIGNVQITEFDISASDGYQKGEVDREQEFADQADRYKHLYWTLKNYNKTGRANVTGITMWGTVDHYSWLQSRSDLGGGNTTGLPQCPLLFDENYQPKPAYDVFVGK